MDPLAVLMAKVWTTPVDIDVVSHLVLNVLTEVGKTSENVSLPWIDEDKETKEFTEFWFGDRQRADLRRLSYVLSERRRSRMRATKKDAIDVLQLALSRIIITKEQGASLARDTSHSRPHRVSETSNFDVLSAFERSVKRVCRILGSAPPPGSATISRGDARSLKSIKNSEIDVVLTSPPYLNAIDYMRGHRLSLVWLGHPLSNLRQVRTNSIGAERSPNTSESVDLFSSIQESMAPIELLTRRDSLIVARYAEDVYRLMSEVARVLKPQGKAILIVGNSCLKGVFIRNSQGVVKAGSMAGLKLVHQIERDLPMRQRYLPMPADKDMPLGKRMRTESILTFASS
jgi:hypothetical protein